MPGVAPTLTHQLKFRLDLFRTALVRRRITKLANDFDIVISADDEMVGDRKIIQYVHFPRFEFPWRLLQSENSFSRLLAWFYDSLCAVVSHFNKSAISNNLTPVNSNYIKQITDRWR